MIMSDSMVYVSSQHGHKDQLQDLELLFFGKEKELVKRLQTEKENFLAFKKEVDQERQHSMLVKKEITENKSYPNRGELIKAERAELLKKQNQL